MQLNIQLPKTLQSLSNEHKLQIVYELQKALSLGDVKPQAVGLERTIWTTNDEKLLGEAEDELYEILANHSMDNMAELIAGLGLSEEVQGYEDLDQDVLQKSLDNGKHKISDLIKLSNAKRKDFLKYIKDGTDWTRKKLKQIDDIMKQKLPDYEKLAEQFAVRSAFIAKIRSHADTEMLSTVGSFVDRFPSTIKASSHEGLVLTANELGRGKTGVKVKILPLQPQEIRAVEHASIRAGDKLTEINDKHRAGVRQLIIQAQNERWSAQRLAQALFDKFGEQNRDWRRVAITELAMASNDAFVAGCSEGDELWVPPVQDSCNYCKKFIENKSFIVTTNVDADPLKYIWVGKSNYGRTVKEWIPCVPLHPNCRHRLHKFSRFYKVNAEGKPVLKTTVELIQEERVRRGMGLDPNLR